MSKNIFFTKFSELSGNRFDTSYYIPELVELENKVTNISKKRLKDFVLSVSSGATPKMTEQAEYYTEDKKLGVPFLRVQNLSTQGNLDTNNVKYINKKTHEGMLKRSQVEENDLLIKITGVGRMAIASVPDIGFKGNTNQHMAVVKTKSRLVSQTLATYLNLDIAEKLASRRATGGTRPALDYPALLSIPIIYDEDIVTRLNEASKLKAEKEKEAQDKLVSIDRYLLDELGLSIDSNEKEDLTDRVFIRKLSQISGDRFDSDYYRNYFYQNINKLKENKSCKLLTLGDITKNIFQGLGQNLTNKEEHILLKVKNIKNNNKINFDDVEFIEDVPESKILLDNDIITPFIGEAIKKYKFSVFIKPNNNYNYTVDNNTGVIRLKDKYNSVYISAFLMSSIGKVLIKQLSGGGGVPFLGSNSASKLYIPMPIKGNTIDFEKQNTIAKHIQTLRDEAKALKDEANKIYEDSKKEVEKMILGDSL